MILKNEIMFIQLVLIFSKFLVKPKLRDVTCSLAIAHKNNIFYSACDVEQELHKPV